MRKTATPKAIVPARLVAAARELRDRYLEQINADPPDILNAAKYALTRELDHRALPASRAVALLPMAA